MAITQTNGGLDVVLDAGRTFFHHKREQVLAALARRKVYRKTLSELSGLDDRALGDLGIPRYSIKRLALETAYD